MRKTVLICPLDWGLGHATRCVPIIKELIADGARVIIAADNRPLAFLKKEFPDLEFVVFPGFNIVYPDSGSMVLKMLFSIPKILKGIRKEHRLLSKIISDKNIDIVISDNRFGLWNNSVKTVFITHQLMVKCPKQLKFLEFFLHKQNKRIIKKYDECWFPDFDSLNNLSADLSHKNKKPGNAHFIGPLSRFIGYAPSESHNEMVFDLIAILSGPEPQRTIFENIITEQVLANPDIKAVIIQGKTDCVQSKVIMDNIEIYPHLDTEALFEKISKSRLVLCRSGYSSIMDLARTGKKAILVPTPGQTEQEYLAKYFMNKNIFYASAQKRFILHDALAKANSYTGITAGFDYSVLKNRIKYLLEG